MVLISHFEKGISDILKTCWDILASPAASRLIKDFRLPTHYWALLVVCIGEPSSTAILLTNSESSNADRLSLCWGCSLTLTLSFL